VARDIVRAEGSGVENLLMVRISTTKVRKLNKNCDQQPRYEELLVLKKPAPSSSTTVLHNCALNALSGSRMRRLMR